MGSNGFAVDFPQYFAIGSNSETSSSIGLVLVLYENITHVCFNALEPTLDLSNPEGNAGIGKQAMDQVVPLYH